MDYCRVSLCVLAQRHDRTAAKGRPAADLTPRVFSSVCSQTLSRPVRLLFASMPYRLWLHGIGQLITVPASPLQPTARRPAG